MSSLMPRLDRVTRLFWRTVGRPVDLAGEHAWLDAPMHAGPVIGDGWLADAAASWAAASSTTTRRPGCSPTWPRSTDRGSGRRTSGPRSATSTSTPGAGAWRSGPSGRRAFQPGGELVSRVFGRRVQQLALPTRPLDVAHGMDSRVTVLDRRRPDDQRAAGWIRTLRSTGEYVYSGCYSSRCAARADRPSVHVTFPLEEGNVQVFLRPRVLPGRRPRARLAVGSLRDGRRLRRRPGRRGGVRRPRADPRDVPGVRRPRRQCSAPTTTCGCGRPPPYGCTTSSS